MKIKAEVLITSKKEINYNKIFITGSDESFIGYVKNYIIKDFKRKGFFVDLSGNYSPGIVGSLFSDKKTLFLLSGYPFKKNEIDYNNSKDQHILIAAPNGSRANTIRSLFLKLDGALIIECYPLNRKTKEIILKIFIEENNLTLSNNVYWYVLDNLDNNYVVFISQLETLVLFNDKIDLISDIEKIIFVENKLELNKIFFNIFKSNKLLTEIFNKNIDSVSNFYIFLNSTKLYLEIIKNSPNKENALHSFPRYLFAEKDIFLKIYNQMNKNKLIKVYSQLSKVESLTRKHPGLYSLVGLRFFLNLRKIIIS